MRARLVALALAASALPIVSSQGWSALPFAATGTDGAVSALAFLDCSGAAPAGLCAAGGPALLVGGAFSSIGGLPAGSSGARGVAAFLPSASAWALAAPSGGLDGPASALAASEDGIVYVGGFFDTAGGVAASNIAALNASEGTWSAMGVGLDAACKALALQGGMLYAGGLFSTAGGVAASRVAAYSLVTGEWTALGTNTVDNYVYALLGGVVLPGVASGVALAGAFSKPSLSISLWDPAQAAYDLPGAGLPIRNRGWRREYGGAGRGSPGPSCASSRCGRGLSLCRRDFYRGRRRRLRKCFSHQHFEHCAVRRVGLVGPRRRRDGRRRAGCARTARRARWHALRRG